MREIIQRIEILGRVTEKVYDILEDDIFIALDVSDQDFLDQFADKRELIALKENLEIIRIKLYECLHLTI